MSPEPFSLVFCFWHLQYGRATSREYFVPMRTQMRVDSTGQIWSFLQSWSDEITSGGLMGVSKDQIIATNDQNEDRKEPLPEFLTAEQLGQCPPLGTPF